MFKLFLKNQHKKGVTLIEILLVVAISTILVVSGLQIQQREVEDARIDKFSNDVALITQAVMRRMDNDAPSFESWEQTFLQQQGNGNPVAGPWAGAFPLGSMPTPPIYVPPTGAPLNIEAINFPDTESVVKSLMRNFLVGRDVTYPECGGWDPEVDAFGIPDDSVRSQLVQCRLWQIGNNVNVPYNIEVQASVVGSTITGEVSDFLFYINMNNDLTDDDSANGTGMASGRRIQDYIENNFKQELIGAQYTELVGDIGLLHDKGDDVLFVGNRNIQCQQAIDAGNPCFLRILLDVTDTGNDKFLRVDGSNDMRASISFRGAGAGAISQCLRWEPDGGGGFLANAPFDCGIAGGIDSPDSVDGVFDITNTQHLFITPRDGAGVPFTDLCNVFERPADINTDYLDRDGAGLLLISGTTPCGLTHDGDIIQLLIDESHAEVMYTEDLIAEDIRANQVSVRKSPYGNLLLEILDETGDPLFTINDDGVNVTLNMGDAARAANTNINLEGVVQVSQNFTANSNSFFALDAAGELVQYQIGTSTLAIENDLSDITETVDATEFTTSSFGGGNINRSYLGINYTSGVGDSGFGIQSDTNILVQANDGINLNSGQNINLNANDRINLDSDTLVTGTNKIYSNSSSLRDSDIGTINAGSTFNDIEGNNAEQRNFEFVTRDIVTHLENLSNDISLRSVTLVGNAAVTNVGKPDCFDFVTALPNDFSNPYFGTQIYDDVSGGAISGFDYARILLIPVWMKTYSYGFGDNQAYAHQAVDLGANQWQVYNYLSGEGLSGTGAREDAAGASLALLYCDYTGVDFTTLN